MSYFEILYEIFCLDLPFLFLIFSLRSCIVQVKAKIKEIRLKLTDKQVKSESDLKENNLINFNNFSV